MWSSGFRTSTDGTPEDGGERRGWQTLNTATSMCGCRSCLRARHMFLALLSLAVVTTALHYHPLIISVLSNSTTPFALLQLSRPGVPQSSLEIAPSAQEQGPNVSTAAKNAGGHPNQTQVKLPAGKTIDTKTPPEKAKAQEKTKAPETKVDPQQMCPEKPPIEETKVPLNLTEMTYEELKRSLGQILTSGGHYAPSTCKARERVALIIPYRDRWRNLLILLHNLVPFLVRQQTEFTIFLVEQTEEYRFNRCLMFNVGYVQSQKMGDFTCFILHDTDLIPRDYRNIYRCHQKPRHLVLSRSNEHWMERLPYHSFVGGAIALRKQHMDKINGCSNSYYGWGLEDDDLQIRLSRNGFPVIRYPIEIGGYYSLDHKKQTDNPSRGKLVKTMSQRMKKEGLNTLNYTLVQSQRQDLYTHLVVKVPPPPNL